MFKLDLNNVSESSESFDQALNDLKKLFNYLTPCEIEYYNCTKEKVEPDQEEKNEDGQQYTT